jgi:hypothetical protein
MTDPVTKELRPVTLERESYVEHLRALLYSTGGARFVPIVIHRAFLQDFIPFQTMAMRYNLGGPATSRGMYFSVTCSNLRPSSPRPISCGKRRGPFSAIDDCGRILPRARSGHEPMCRRASSIR